MTSGGGGIALADFAFFDGLFDKTDDETKRKNKNNG